MCRVSCRNSGRVRARVLQWMELSGLAPPAGATAPRTPEPLAVEWGLAPGLGVRSSMPRRFAAAEARGCRALFRPLLALTPVEGCMVRQRGDASAAALGSRQARSSTVRSSSSFARIPTEEAAMFPEESRRRTTVLAPAHAIAVLVLGATADAQEPPRFPATTEIVRIDAVVVDKAGRPVTGLTADDFTIEENGRPRPIASFEPIVVRSAAEPPEPKAPPSVSVSAPRAIEPQEGRALLIYFDDIHVSPPGAEWVRRNLGPFLQREIRTGDVVTIVAPHGNFWWTARTPWEHAQLPAVVAAPQGPVQPQPVQEREERLAGDAGRRVRVEDQGGPCRRGGHLQPRRDGLAVRHGPAPNPAHAQRSRARHRLARELPGPQVRAHLLRGVHPPAPRPVLLPRVRAHRRPVPPRERGPLRARIPAGCDRAAVAEDSTRGGPDYHIQGGLLDAETAGSRTSRSRREGGSSTRTTRQKGSPTCSRSRRPTT